MEPQTSLLEQEALIPEPSSLRLSRWAMRRSVIFLVVGVAYIANLLTSWPLTLGQVLLYTLTYGAWLVIFATQKELNERVPLWWFGALGVLAFLSQFLYLSTSNLDWLPMLAITTACILTGATPRYLGLGAAVILWLSSSMAFALSLQYWDLDAELILLISFSSFVALSWMLREIIQAQT